jgi:hypothetical protein
MNRYLEEIQRAEIHIRAARAVMEMTMQGDEMTDRLTREQLAHFDIRAAWRRGYVEGFQVALMALAADCPRDRYAELSAWVQDQLIRWRFGRIDVDNRPPEPPGLVEHNGEK